LSRAGADAPARRCARPERGERKFLIALIAVALLLTACGRKADYIDWQRMEQQAKGVPYRDTSYFSDGRVLQLPPDETVSREDTLGEPQLTEGVVGAKYADRIPFRVTAEIIERGRERFNITCAACHGLAGDGESEVAKQMTLRKPPSLVEPLIRAYPPGRIFRVITFGYGLMPSYRSHLSVPDRWAVIAYVRALQLASGTKLVDLPAPVRDEAQKHLGGAP